MTDPTPAPRIVHVEYARARGFLLEIEGSAESPFVLEDDAIRHTKSCAEEAVHEVLGIPEDVPLELVMTTDDNELWARSGDDIEPVDD
ncbi:hypothetical protein ACFV6F_07585 [Kitasatospora phosalacinea]|uniref:hypothetical protein n=1 Tax=Kitasatospora phosalacinea TaxID=2065 RepID=UPI00366298C5